MPNARFEGLLAGTAVALALTLMPYGNGAFAASEAQISAAVPMPPIDDLSPPTVSDIGPAATPTQSKARGSTATVPAATDTEATAPATAAPKAATLPPAADKLREQLAAGKFDRVLGGKKERSAVEAFYASRDFAPLWIADGALSARAKAAAEYLSKVDADGLDPSDYPLPQVKAGLEPDAAADAEIKFTDAILTYTRHAAMGRVHYSRVAGDILYTLVKPEPAEVLAKLAQAGNVGEALDGYEPQQPGYKALKAKLAEVRHAPPAQEAAEEKKTEHVRVPDGKMLRPGMSDPRVAAVRKRLDVDGNKDSPLYDEAVAEAIKAFQTESDITADGMLGPQTVRAMNGEKPKVRRASIDPVDVIIANLERWRWMPRDLGATYVMVNIPDYTLRVVHDGKLVWKTKVVVGQPGKPTPLLSADMKFITVNPTWNVPPSIIQNEYLPALQQDPQAMDRIGLKVEQNRDGTIRIYQPPGDKNALGRIRFNFPNKFLVYQHDTPDKYLFKKEARAYSHGCMRVENPLKYGEVLLSLALPKEHYTEERLHKMFGGGEININFPTGIPDHLTYQTAFVDEAGKLQLRDDVYGRDARLLAILKGSDRKVADISIERSHGSSSAAVRMPPGTFGSGIFGGPSFFERLFGAAEPGPPRPRSQMGRAGDRHNYR